jgi:hypothetical protein
MSIVLQWDDSGLEKIFRDINGEAQQKIYAAALKSVGGKLRKMAVSDANAAGFGKTGKITYPGGWQAVRYGRIPRSIAVGKLVRRRSTGYMTLRVFNRRSAGFLSSAPHAHLAYLGHVIWIPTPNVKGEVSSQGNRTRKNPVYNRAFNAADDLFVKEMEAAVRRMVRRINRKNGGAV